MHRPDTLLVYQLDQIFRGDYLAKVSQLYLTKEGAQVAAESYATTLSGVRISRPPEWRFIPDDEIYELREAEYLWRITPREVKPAPEIRGVPPIDAMAKKPSESARKAPSFANRLGKGCATIVLAVGAITLLAGILLAIRFALWSTGICVGAC